MDWNKKELGNMLTLLERIAQELGKQDTMAVTDALIKQENKIIDFVDSLVNGKG